MRRARRRKRFTLHTVRRARRWKQLTAALLILGGVVLGAGTMFYIGLLWFQGRAPLASEGEAVAVSWPPGLDADDAAALLADLELTDYPSAMAVYLRATGGDICAEPGPHLFARGATPQELVDTLCRAQTRPKVKVTIPEGYNRFSIAKRLEEKGVCHGAAFLHASADARLLYRAGIEPAARPEANTAEGFLFPATYELAVNTAPNDIVLRLVAESERRWKRAVKKYPAGWERLQAELELSRRDVVNLAAMVEKEAAVADERATIASVFLNRLRNREYPHLQSDPTAMYGCLAMPDEIPACENWNGRASGKINRDDKNTFSTYVTRGLPPGPIANPGDGSLAAVLDPADTSFYFFVAKGKGRHEFTETYDAHKQAVKRLRER